MNGPRGAGPGFGTGDEPCDDRIDVAWDLLDRFGGDPRSRWAAFADALAVRFGQALPGLAGIALIAAGALAYRRATRRP